MDHTLFEINCHLSKGRRFVVIITFLLITIEPFLKNCSSNTRGLPKVAPSLPSIAPAAGQRMPSRTGFDFIGTGQGQTLGLF